MLGKGSQSATLHDYISSGQLKWSEGSLHWPEFTYTYACIYIITYSIYILMKIIVHVIMLDYYMVFGGTLDFFLCSGRVFNWSII